jgi:hypothetical protein
MKQTFGLTRNQTTSLWDVEKLWAYSESLPAVDWEIPESFKSQWSWGDDSPEDHVQRCVNSDLAYPILVWNGKIIDGCHRTIKALALGHKTVSAKVIGELPPPDEVFIDILLTEYTDDETEVTFGIVVELVRSQLI